MILNFNKPCYISSFSFIYNIKKRHKLKKISHAGTLDPLAEGVMIVLTDNDCKKQEMFMKLDKEYEARILIGASSPSYDLEKQLTFENNIPQLNKKALEDVLKSLEGEITLPVPMFSAKRISGTRLYKMARREKEPNEMPMMNSKVYSITRTGEETFDYFGHEYPVIKLLISCSSGTYIRTLAHEIGQRLGTSSVLLHLKRTKVGDFTLLDSKSEDSNLV